MTFLAAMIDKPIQEPTVSVVMPVYNGEAFIADSIISVIHQSYQNWELIVVDDASVDTSVERVKAFCAQDARIHLIQLEENSGTAVARNKAIEYAKGRYIAFLDGDDLWLPHKLERQLAFMLESGASFSYCAYEKIDSSIVTLGKVGAPAKIGYSELLKTCTIGCLTAMYDTKHFGKVYMPNIRKRQDFGLWLELLKRAKYAYGLNEILAYYRVRSDSISANKLSAAQYTWRLYRDVEKLNLILSSYYFSHYVVRGLLRTKAPALARKLGVLK
jgi:teichuronic acid biosynthesis glycosyltransferase TuaG